METIVQQVRLDKLDHGKISLRKVQVAQMEEKKSSISSNAHNLFGTTILSTFFSYKTLLEAPLLNGDHVFPRAVDGR